MSVRNLHHRQFVKSVVGMKGWSAVPQVAVVCCKCPSHWTHSLPLHPSSGRQFRMQIQRPLHRTSPAEQLDYCWLGSSFALVSNYRDTNEESQDHAWDWNANNILSAHAYSPQCVTQASEDIAMSICDCFALLQRYILRQSLLRGHTWNVRAFYWQFGIGQGYRCDRNQWKKNDNRL